MSPEEAIEKRDAHLQNAESVLEVAWHKEYAPDTKRALQAAGVHARMADLYHRISRDEAP